MPGSCPFVCCWVPLSLSLLSLECLAHCLRAAGVALAHCAGRESRVRDLCRAAPFSSGCSNGLGMGVGTHTAHGLWQRCRLSQAHSRAHAHGWGVLAPRPELLMPAPASHVCSSCCCPFRDSGPHCSAEGPLPVHRSEGSASGWPQCFLDLCSPMPAGTWHSPAAPHPPSPSLGCTGLLVFPLFVQDVFLTAS